MKTDLTLHPIQVVLKLAEKYPELKYFSFSQYQYSPRAIEDKRTFHQVAPLKVLDWFIATQATLGPQEDLALHSRVEFKDGKTWHIPMIDFKEMPEGEDFPKLTEALDLFGVQQYMFFNSGRSLHFYALNLLSEHDWLVFLGRALLLNLPQEKELVDVRWVGHRLMGGYGTLRWTKNNSHYLKVPEKYLP